MNVFELMASLSLDSSAYESGLKKAQGSANSAGSIIGKGLGSAAKLAGAALAGATTAVVGFGVSSVKAGAEFDTAMSEVAATMGDKAHQMVEYNGQTTDSMEALTDFAMKMGAETKYSSTEAAEALNYMALAGYDVQTSMDMLPNVLNLASAGNIELAAASDMVTDAQSALGLSTEETTKLVDEMAKASSYSNTSVAQLGEAILTVGGTAKDMAGGTTELTASLGVLANAGIKGAEGGTLLRNVLLSLIPRSTAAAEAMDEVGLNAYDAEGNMRPLKDTFKDLAAGLDGMSTKERQNVLKNIFNKVDLKGVNAMLAQATDGFDKMTYALQASSVDWEKYSSEPWAKGEEAMANLTETIASNLEEQGKSTEEVTQMLADKYGLAMEDAANAVNTVNEQINNGGSTWTQLEEAIENSKGAAEEMAKVKLDNLNGDIQLIQSAFNNVQLLVAGKLTPDLRSFVQIGTNGLSQMATALKAGDMSGAIDAFTGILTQGLNAIISGLPQAIQAGMQLLGAVAQGIANALPTLGASALQIVNILVTSLTSAIPSLMAEAPNLITGLIDGIMSGLDALTESAVTIMEALTQGIQANFPTMISAFMNGLVELSANLRSNASTLVDAGLAMITSIAEGLIQSLPVLIQTIPVIITNLANIINDNAPKLLMTGVKLLGELAIGLVQAIPTLVASIPQIIEAAVAVFMAFNWINLGGNIIKFIGNGIKSLGSAVPNTLKNIGQTAVDWLKTIQWSTLGADIIDLIKIGIEGLINVIPNTLKLIGQTALDWVKTIQWSTLGADIIDLIKIGIESLVSAIPNALLSIGKAAVAIFKAIPWVQLGKFVITFIANALMSNGSKIMTTLKNAGTKAWNAFKSINWLDLGSNLIKGIINGVKNGVGKLKDAVKDAAKKALDSAKSALGIHSPSRVFRDQVGKFISLGIAQGITQNLGAVENSLSELDSLAQSPDIASDNAYTVAAKGAGTSTSNTSNNIVINVYGAAGQSVDELAEKIEQKIAQATRRKEVVFA